MKKGHIAKLSFLINQKYFYIFSFFLALSVLFHKF